MSARASSASPTAHTSLADTADTECKALLVPPYGDWAMFQFAPCQGITIVRVTCNGVLWRTAVTSLAEIAAVPVRKLPLPSLLLGLGIVVHCVPSQSWLSVSSRVSSDL